jgi:uncharacterized membrane protein YdfJ with MMPL/SSD domain
MPSALGRSDAIRVGGALVQTRRWRRAPVQMGIILGFAVLLDALLVRLMLVPILLRITGRAAWWLLGWLDRLLPNVRFGQ